MKGLVSMIKTFLHTPIEIVCTKMVDGQVAIKFPDGYVNTHYPVQWLLADGGKEEIRQQMKVFAKNAPDRKLEEQKREFEEFVERRRRQWIASSVSTNTG
jgi:hypothetical protein